MSNPDLLLNDIITYLMYSFVVIFVFITFFRILDESYFDGVLGRWIKRKLSK